MESDKGGLQTPQQRWGLWGVGHRFSLEWLGRMWQNYQLSSRIRGFGVVSENMEGSRKGMLGPKWQLVSMVVLPVAHLLENMGLGGAAERRLWAPVGDQTKLVLLSVRECLSLTLFLRGSEETGVYCRQQGVLTQRWAMGTGCFYCPWKVGCASGNSHQPADHVCTSIYEL